MAQGQLLALQRTRNNGTATGSRDTGKKDPMLSRGETDGEGRPTGKVIGTNDKSNTRERGF